MNTQVINHSEKSFFCNDKWLELLREALSALNIALKKIDILKNYITKTIRSTTKYNAKGKKEKSNEISSRENEISENEYFSPTALSQLFQSQSLRHQNDSECILMDISSKDDIQNNYFYKEAIKGSPTTNLIEKTVKHSSGKIRYISPVSEKRSSVKKNRKRRSRESLSELPRCLNDSNAFEEEINGTNKYENMGRYYAEEHQSINSFQKTFCDSSEPEITSISGEEVLKVRFKINNNRIQDTEVIAALEKEGFHNCVVKVKNKETYSRGQILFSGDEVKKAAGKNFNILIQNQPLLIRHSLNVSSFLSSPASGIKNSTEIETEESVKDEDSIVVNDELESGRVSPKTTQELNINEIYSTATGSTPEVEMGLSPQKSSVDRTKDTNIDISKDIAVLSACSIELMKSVSESLSLGATLIGEPAQKTDKLSPEIFRSCGFNFVSSGELSPSMSVLGTNNIKESIGSNNDCCLETSGSAASKMEVCLTNGNSIINITNNKSKSTSEESEDYECKKQSPIHKGNDSGAMIGEGILINISHGQPPPTIAEIITHHDHRECSDRSAPELDIITDVNENDNSTNITKKIFMDQANESENCKAKFGKNGFDTGNNYRAEIDESMLINISCGYPSIRDTFPKKGKYNEMGRNSPVPSMIDSDTSEGKLSDDKTTAESIPYNKEPMNNSNIPYLRCSESQAKEALKFDSFIQVNSVASNKYRSNFERCSRGRFEQNKTNNFNFSNRPQYNNLTINNFRSFQPNTNIIKNSNRNFNFHPNYFPHRRSVHSQGSNYTKRWNNRLMEYPEKGSSTENHKSFTPFSQPSSSSANRNANEFRNNTYNLNTKKRQQFYQRKSC